MCVYKYTVTVTVTVTVYVRVSVLPLMMIYTCIDTSVRTPVCMFVWHKFKIADVALNEYSSMYTEIPTIIDPSAAKY